MMRERLVELIKQGDKTFADKYEGKVMSHIDEVYDFVADCLLENGVIVLRCKVGDTIFRIDDKQVFDWWEIEHIQIYAEEIVYIDDSDNRFTAEDIGKTVFLTREEAEQALKGGAE